MPSDVTTVALPLSDSSANVPEPPAHATRRARIDAERTGSRAAQVAPSRARIEPSPRASGTPTTRRARIDAERGHAGRRRAVVARALADRRAARGRDTAVARDRSAAGPTGGVVVPVRGGRSAAAAGPVRRAANRATAGTALLFAAGLVVATSLPAEASWVPAPASAAGGQTGVGAGQSLVVPRGTATADPVRDDYTVTDLPANRSATFVNDPDGAVQWPFPTGVPITSGFGARAVPDCSFCSTFHEGADFAPGAGTPIHVVADGEVVKVQGHDGGYGNDVWVQHDVAGRRFVSVYGHMADGSFRVVPGQRVHVGDELGLVGSTGNSTGPHLHLEVHVGGVAVDPIAWLRANVG